MNKKIILAASLLSAAFFLTISGCGSSGNAGDVSAGSITSVPQEAVVSASSEEETVSTLEAEAVELASIGTESDSSYVLTMQVVNKTAHSIKGFAVKNTDAEEYPENMLEDGDVFDIEETRNLYFDPTVDANYGTYAGSLYSVQLTLDDNTEVEIEEFPFTYTDKLEIHLIGNTTEDGGYTVYLTYTSSLTGEDVDTRYLEEDAESDESEDDSDSEEEDSMSRRQAAAEAAAAAAGNTSDDSDTDADADTEDDSDTSSGTLQTNSNMDGEITNGETALAAYGLNIRATADSNGTVLMTLVEGCAVTVIYTDDEWTLVDYQGTQGYVATRLLKEDDGSGYY